MGDEEIQLFNPRVRQKSDINTALVKRLYYVGIVKFLLLFMLHCLSGVIEKVQGIMFEPP